MYILLLQVLLINQYRATPCTFKALSRLQTVSILYLICLTCEFCTSMQWSTDRCIPCSQLPFLFTVASYNVIFIATYKYVTNQLATCLLLFSCTLAHHLLKWKEVCSKMLIEFCMFQLNIMNAVINKQLMLTLYEIYTKWPSYITNQSSQITIPSLQSCVHAWSAHARVYIYVQECLRTQVSPQQLYVHKESSLVWPDHFLAHGIYRFIFACSINTWPCHSPWSYMPHSYLYVPNAHDCVAYVTYSQLLLSSGSLEYMAILAVAMYICISIQLFITTTVANYNFQHQQLGLQ